jgi:hypothetical protein
MHLGFLRSVAPCSDWQPPRHVRQVANIDDTVGHNVSASIESRLSGRLAKCRADNSDIGTVEYAIAIDIARSATGNIQNPDSLVENVVLIATTEYDHPLMGCVKHCGVRIVWTRRRA